DLGNRMGDAYAVPVQFIEDHPTHFCVLVSLYSRSALFIYDHERTLIYHEILPDPTTGIAAIPEPGRDTECLLVGGEGKVWRYRWDEERTGRSEASTAGDRTAASVP